MQVDHEVVCDRPSMELLNNFGRRIGFKGIGIGCHGCTPTSIHGSVRSVVAAALPIGYRVVSVLAASSRHQLESACGPRSCDRAAAASACLVSAATEWGDRCTATGDARSPPPRNAASRTGAGGHRRGGTGTTVRRGLRPDGSAGARARSPTAAALRASCPLAEDGDLAAVSPRLQVAPGERGDLRHTEAGDVSNRSRTWFRRFESSARCVRRRPRRGCARRACPF